MMAADHVGEIPEVMRAAVLFGPNDMRVVETRAQTGP